MRKLTTVVAAVVVAGVAAGAALFAPKGEVNPAAPDAPGIVAPAQGAAAAAKPAPHADPAAAKAPGKELTAKECAAICTAKMNAMGMEGSCPESMCKPGVCPMMSGSHDGGAGEKPAEKP